MADNLESVGGIKAEAELDLTGFDAGTQKLTKNLEQLNPTLKKTEAGMNAAEKAGKGAAAAADRASESHQKLNESMKGSDMAARALHVTLGQLGAGSIEAVISKIKAFTQEAAKLAIAMEGVAARSKAVFKGDFAQVTAELDKMAASFGRSNNDLQEFATSFATTLDSIGVAPNRVKSLSLELTKLTVELGKAFPDRSDTEIYQVIESAIQGNVRGLRSLGISLKDAQLQEFAHTQGIKGKLAAMSEEEKAQLRAQYLLTQTSTILAAANDVAVRNGDIAKENAARWQNWMEIIGKYSLPIFNAVSKGILDNIDAIVSKVAVAQNALLNFFTLGYASQFNALSQKDAEIKANAEKILATGQRQAAGIKLSDLDKSSHTGGMSGGGGSENKDEVEALRQFKEYRSAIEQTEKKILEDIGKQADENKKRLTLTRDELAFKRDIGTITAAESRELDLINNRVEMQSDKVGELKDRWKDTVDQVKKAREEVQQIADDITKLDKDNAAALKDVDADTARKKQDWANEQVKKKNDIEKELRESFTLSADDRMKKEKELRDLNEQFDKMRKQKGGTSILQEADRVNALDPLAKIDDEGKQKKIEIATKFNEKLDELTQKQIQAQVNLDGAIAKSEEAQQRVVDAMDSLRQNTESTYSAMTATVTANVNAQVAELARLQAAVEGLKGSYSGLDSAASAGGSASQVKRKFASGGFVSGPGTGTSDSIPALLSNGEYVIKAQATAAYRPLLDAINSMRLPRFAQGGPVTTSVNNARNISLQQHFHGDSGGLLSNPALIKYHLRAAVR